MSAPPREHRMREQESLRPSVTVAAIIEREGRFLLVEEETRYGPRLNQPAGHLEGGETVAAGAVRETLEETGVDVARDGRLLGHLDDLYPRTPTLPPIIIRPFVALVRADVAIVPSHEVAAAFWVPVSALAERGAWTTGTVSVRGIERRVQVFEHGEYTVWGLTERVLRQLLTFMGEAPANGS